MPSDDTPSTAVKPLVLRKEAPATGKHLVLKEVALRVLTSLVRTLDPSRGALLAKPLGRVADLCAKLPPRSLFKDWSPPSGVPEAVVCASHYHSRAPTMTLFIRLVHHCSLSPLFAPQIPVSSDSTNSDSMRSSQYDAKRALSSVSSEFWSSSSGRDSSWWSCELPNEGDILT